MARYCGVTLDAYRAVRAVITAVVSTIGHLYFRKVMIMPRRSMASSGLLISSTNLSEETLEASVIFLPPSIVTV